MMRGTPELHHCEIQEVRADTLETHEAENARSEEERAASDSALQCLSAFWIRRDSETARFLDRSLMVLLLHENNILANCISFVSNET